MHDVVRQAILIAQRQGILSTGLRDACPVISVLARLHHGGSQERWVCRGDDHGLLPIFQNPTGGGAI